MNQRWEAVAFDLDGLLIDSEPFFMEAARRLLAKRGVDFDPTFMQRIMGMPGRDSLPLFQSHFGLQDSVEELGADYRYFFTEACEGSLIPLQAGARAMIDRLGENDVPMVIATSSRRVYVDGVFAPHGLLDRFQRIFTADDVANGKPSPDIYLLAANHFGIEPKKLLVFEDSPIGVRAAKAAGCTCVAVPQKHTPNEKVDVADFIARSLVEDSLLDWLMR